MAEKIVKKAEVIMLRDRFGHLRLKEGKYTPGQIDTKWTDEINEDFYNWLKENVDNLPIPRKAIEELMQQRTW